ncbi:MAG: DUF1080 domain-containing protein [Lentisphaeria bacterium]|nr:DUF1080 domain-containing protein [Lentisphaeria bacterium]
MADQPKPAPGYEDTPFIPGSCWRVHDAKRPQPRVVTPGTFSTQEAAGTPPSDAVVLFDGRDLSNWVGKDGGPAEWALREGSVEVVPGKGDIRTRMEFGDCQLHVEWREPTEIRGESQGRGNSGVFLMGLYEIQVLDCHDNRTYADGTTGALYGQCPPLVNACRGPGEWQTYDIVWIAPRFAGEKLLSPAYVTVFQNGILLHVMKELQGPTQHRKATEYKPHPPVGPLKLQDHKDPVRFRNLWYRPLTAYDEVRADA